MSRFYDALREAGRVRQSAHGEVEKPNWEPLVNSIRDTSAGNDSILREAGVPTAVLTDEIPDITPKENATTPVDLEPIATKRSELKAFGRKALIQNAVDPLVVEQYRRLRTKLIQYHSKHAFRSIVITSPAPNEGKTVTVLNLALSFAMLPSFKVLVVDGDLRRGSLGKWLGVGDRPGLSNLVEGSATLEEVILTSEEVPIHFIGSGNSKARAGELLQSNDVGVHLRKMTEQFALVLVDSPPVNLITDAQLLAAGCDGVILVTRAFSTTRKALERAVQDLQPFRVIGSILNGGSRSQLYGRYKGYY